MTDTVARGAAPTGDRVGYRTKLIEVALPLEAINREAAREKSIRHGHPSTLHLWWARRPLAACRAVLFAQMVDDPSAVPEEFSTEAEQQAERDRLFRIIEQLVKWENTTNEAVLTAARREIARSVARAAGVPGPETEEDIWRILREHAPPVLDPFCGGGSIPLEAQRLGLEAHASDLNPVAVLITKALIEIPPKFAGMPPVNPEDRGGTGAGGDWPRATGLAADVRYYGKWMRDEAEKRIGHLYPKVKLPRDQGGGEATVIAWLWARTVTCPNPVCGATMPLVRSFALSTKKGKETWVEPIVDREAKTVRFEIRSGRGKAPEGTVNRRGARCIVCETPVPFDWIRAEGKAGRMGDEMMAVVAEGRRGRIYLPPAEGQVAIARSARPEWEPEASLPEQALGFRVQGYGMTRWADLFTLRQLVALTTFSDLVGEARERVLEDARAAVMPEGEPLHEGGNGATAYAEATATYLGFGVSRLTDICNALCRWETSKTQVRNLFGRQTISMIWDFAEPCVFSNSAGDFGVSLGNLLKAVEGVPAATESWALQGDAARGLGWAVSSEAQIVSTDPPYYDNIGYADLSDFFYVWLRPMLRGTFPGLFTTVLTPKVGELVAAAHRFGGDSGMAETFFESGLEAVFARINVECRSGYPVAVYYAFKQEEEDDGGVSSTGWETMLAALLQSGFEVTGTWPLRSELANRPRNRDSNALASSIVLVCRPRAKDAWIATHREFVAALRHELPPALVHLQRENIAPVDLAQASIGPGMKVFSRYARVLESDGSAMTVRTALQIINQELDRFLTEQEGEMDRDTRFCVAWFEQFGMNEGEYGVADVLARAKDTSVEGLERAGVLDAGRGKVRLRRRAELEPDWNPGEDSRLTDWECCQYLIRALAGGGEGEAARLARRLGGKAQVARDLAYRLYSICDRKKWADEALAYNSLVTSWPAIQEKMAVVAPEQGSYL